MTHHVHSLRGIHAHKDDSNNWEWPLPDGLGSVREVVDNNLNVLENRNYDSYGTGFGNTGTSQTNYGFTGELLDGGGLLDLRARRYAPGLGVFASLDPFEGMVDEPMSINGYSYVHSNPVNWTDPSGECPLCLVAVFSLAAVALGLIWSNFYRNVSTIINNGVCAPDVPDVDDYPNAEDVQRWLDEQRKRFQPEPEYVDPDPKWFPFPFRFPFPNPQPTPRPQPTPTPTPQPCDPERFKQWWNSFPPAPITTLRDSDDDKEYDKYEERVARGIGTMRTSKRIPAGGGETIDADGADPSTCHLLEAKHATDINNPPWRPTGYIRILNQADDEIRRYAGAINMAGSQAKGLEIHTNSHISEVYFSERLTAYGFISNVTGFSRLTS